MLKMVTRYNRKLEASYGPPVALLEAINVNHNFKGGRVGRKKMVVKFICSSDF
jgi:hypothetical protein